MKPRVIIGCEESQEVCKAFRAIGCEAFSNDLIKCSGGHPEWHLQMDVMDAIAIGGWNLGIFHPPCTYLANSGARWLFEKPGRWMRLDEAADFFLGLLDSPIELVAVENPMPHKWATERIGKYTQKIHPWEYGHKQKKTTCLWLRGLPPLLPTEICGPPPKGDKSWEAIWREPPGPNQAKNRSKTFPGIAQAMAEQWGKQLISELGGKV